MRGGDGHAALVRRPSGAGAQPSWGGSGGGDWFVYVNRRRTIVKVLSFDGGGYWVSAKRLEADRFADPGVRGGRKWSLDRTSLPALLEGVDMVVKGRRRLPQGCMTTVSCGSLRRVKDATEGIAERRRDRGAEPDERPSGATVASLEERLAAPQETAAALKDQVDWFKRQLFGRHSEKRVEFDLAEQASLFERLGVGETSAPEVPVEETSYRRRRKVRGDAVNECGLRFDATVPATTIEVEDPEVESIPMSERVVVGEKVTHRLAQRPAPRRARRRAHTAGVEDAVRRRPAALRPRPRPRSARHLAGPKTRLPLRGLVRTAGRTENDLRPSWPLTDNVSDPYGDFPIRFPDAPP